tara:strand:+ start:293 stop:1390 length:1098 start_codon:yes stop_codon:yes gene_type:complete
MKINYNFKKSDISKINGDVVYQLNTLHILKKSGFKIYEGKSDLKFLYSKLFAKISDILLRIQFLPNNLKNFFNFKSRSRNYDFSSYDNILFSHYFYNFDIRIKKIIWSTQGIMEKSYYVDYKNKVSIENDIKLYKKIDKNKKTIFLFWDKKFAKRTKKICNLKSVIKIIPPTLNIEEKINKKIKTDVKKKIKLLFIGKSPTVKGLYPFLDALDDSIFKKFDYHLNVVSNVDKTNTKNISYFQNITEKKKNIFLREADIFIFPSIAETFGYSLMEALAYKCAIITCNYYPLNTFCRNKYNGLLVKKNSSSDIRNSLVSMFESKSLLKKYKDNSFKIYNDKFSKNNFINQFKNLTREYKNRNIKSDI